ncbi:AAA-like domain-containing protein [Tolypothrix sp. VBCCA 56010]|uniref:AAA-like domain-containing protein n=1 Tax=Tolypothrix sp. VBCCA 56010 TaxID=3137731 RepID=UPI003D7DBC91
MSQELELSVVRIYSNTGNVIGSGFLVSDKYILTCSHVVALALQIPAGTSEMPTGTISFDFPRVDSKQKLTATVVFWLPVNSNPSESQEDIAVLRLVNPCPNKAKPVELLPCENVWKHEFLAFGFPKDKSYGVWTEGVLQGANAKGWVQIEVKSENSYRLEEGFSGTPVWDQNLQCVVGMAVAAEKQRQDVKAAFIIPTKVVLEALPQWVKQQVNLYEMKPATQSARIFISYHSQEPDISLAKQFYDTLKNAGHDPFMAKESIQWGEQWSQRIDRELQRCDYFLLLLSEKSANSEMVTREVQQVKRSRDLRSNRKPGILPIRVNFPLSAPLNYELRGYLNEIQQREWKSDADTRLILQDLCKLLANANQSETSDEPVEAELPTISPELENLQRPPLPAAEPELPEGQVDLASTFYVERPPIESDCYKEILKLGALIRIKAARQMGKTSIMARILHYARQQGYSTVQLSFQLADSKVFTDLDEFLRWFCASVGRRLGLPNRLAEHWDKMFGSKENCTSYFEQYLLSSINQPLVLALDEVDCVFQQPKIASDFFGLLRAWHEDAKSRDIWKKLRLVVVHSTEPYISMDVNQSPFNVGLPIELPEFNRQQVLDLARRYGLNWNITQVEQLTAMLGGHPYLVRVGLYHISRQQTTLEQLLKIAPTDAGIFSDHLRRHWWNLKQHPELMDAIAQIVSTTKPVQLEPILAFKLKSMGLIAWENNRVILRCNLYREYFHQLTHSVTAQEPVENQPTNPVSNPSQQLPPVQPANPARNLVYEYQVGGSLPVNALSYVERQADKDLYNELKAGNFCYVLNSRQMGKSSLRVQTMQKLEVEGIACAVIDLTEIGSQEVSSEQWYAGIVRRLERSFQLSVKFNFSSWWSDRSHISPVQRLGEFIDEVLLVEIPQNIVIFIDEIDSVLSLKFPTDDFFALIRNFYNQRADNLKYKRITFTLLGVATPSDFVQDKKRTPFNIGKGIELKGFQLEEAKPLAMGLAGKVNNPKQALQQILQWTGGQPFLTQKICQLIQTDNQRLSVDQLVQSRIIENWETKDEQAHLRTIRDRIWRNEQRVSRLLGLYQQILQQGEIATDNSTEQIDLRLTGLVVQQMGKLRVYNRIYQSVFALDWVKKELAKLRPYAEAFSKWEASGYEEKSYLLRGQALQDALEWSTNKGLSDLDYRFLRDSQVFDRGEVDRAKQVLEKAQKKARLIIRGGFVGLFVIGVVAAGIGLFAKEQAQQAQTANNKARTAEDKARTANTEARKAKDEARKAGLRAETAEGAKSDVSEKFLDICREDRDNESYEDAQKCFLKIIENSPKSSQAYAGLGQTYHMQYHTNENKLDNQSACDILAKAKNNFQEAIDISPNYGWAKSRLKEVQDYKQKLNC